MDTSALRFEIDLTLVSSHIDQTRSKEMKGLTPSFTQKQLEFLIKKANL